MGREYKNQGTKVDPKNFFRDITSRLIPNTTKTVIEDGKKHYNPTVIIEEPNMNGFLSGAYYEAKRLIDKYLRN